MKKPISIKAKKCPYCKSRNKIKVQTVITGPGQTRKIWICNACNVGLGTLTDEEVSSL